MNNTIQINREYPLISTHNADVSQKGRSRKKVSFREDTFPKLENVTSFSTLKAQQVSQKKIKTKQTDYAETEISKESIPVPGINLTLERSNSKTIAAVQDGMTAILEMNSVEIWNTTTSEQMITITPQEQVTALCYAGIGEGQISASLATGTSSGLIEVWNVNSGQKYGSFDLGLPVFAMVYLENSIIAISPGDKQKVIIFDCLKLEIIGSFDTNLPTCSSINNLGSQLLAYGSNQGVIQVWKWNSLIKIFESSISSDVICVCLLGSNTILVGANQGGLFQFDLNNPNSGKNVYPSVGSVLALQKIDASHVACGSFGDFLCILDINTWSPTWIGTSSAVYGFCPPNIDGSFVLASVEVHGNSEDYSDNLLVKCTPSLLKTRGSHPIQEKEKSYRVDFSLIIQEIISSCLQQICAKFEEEIRKHYFPVEEVVDFVYLPQNAFIALRFKQSSNVAIWDCAKKAEIILLEMGKLPVMHLYSKDKYLICRLTDGTKQIWDWNLQERIR